MLKDGVVIMKDRLCLMELFDGIWVMMLIELEKKLVDRFSVLVF